MPTGNLEPINRPPRFWNRPSARRIRMGFLIVFCVGLYGCCGFMARGWGTSDAIYMTVTTMSTVGYGEVRPVSTSGERVHVISLILLSIYSLAYTTAAFVKFMTEGEVYAILGQTRMRKHIEGMDGHVVVAGYGRVGALVCEELETYRQPFVVIERSVDRIPELTRHGFAHVRGDATEEQVLLDAGIARAKTLVCVMPNDANNVFVTLTARQISPNIEIIARAEQPSTTKTLHQAGARHVVLPAAIGAHRIAALLTRPKAVAFAELVTHHPGIELEMLAMVIPETSSLVGKTVVEADIRRKTDVNISAVRKLDGQIEIPIRRSHVFVVGESLMVVGRTNDLEHFRTEFGLVTELGDASGSWQYRNVDSGTHHHRG